MRVYSRAVTQIQDSVFRRKAVSFTAISRHANNAGFNERFVHTRNVITHPNKTLGRFAHGSGSPKLIVEKYSDMGSKTKFLLSWRE
jgi:hypothetical protein